MSVAKYIVFDPEVNEPITWSDTWNAEWEEAWDAGHIEIVDITLEQPKRYGGSGTWIELERV